MSAPVVPRGEPAEAEALVAASQAAEEAASSEAPTLGRLVGAGLRWNLLAQAALRGTSILSGILLARILVPEDFGVFAVALASINLLMSVSDLGITLAVIHWRDDLERAVPTACTLTTTMSLLLYAGCYLGAPALSALMGAPEATGVLRLVTVVILMDGVTAIPSAVLTRDFRQDRHAYATMASLPVNVGVSVGLALLGFGPWALAWGWLAGNTVSGGLVLRFSPVRPRLGFQPEIARGLFAFGLPLAVTLLVEAALLNLDYVIVGHALGPAQLGLYLLAFNVSTWPVNIIRDTARGVAIAGFSRLFGDDDALAAGFQRSFGLLMTVTLPVCLLLGLLAPALVRFLYGERWLAAAGVLPFLVVLGAVRVVSGFLFDLFVGAGRPRTPMWLQLGWLAALVPALIAGTRLAGIRGAGAAHALVAVCVALPLFLAGLRAVRVDLRGLVRRLVRPVLAGCAAAAAGAAFAARLERPVAQLVLAGGAALLVYAALVVPLGELRGLAARGLRSIRSAG